MAAMAAALVILILTEAAILDRHVGLVLIEVPVLIVEPVLEVVHAVDGNPMAALAAACLVPTTIPLVRLVDREGQQLKIRISELTVATLLMSSTAVQTNRQSVTR